MTSHLRRIDVARLSLGGARCADLVWGFVILGTVVRLVTYLMRFPLWVDECMLAENYLDRGFLDLLAPLDNHQVAPIGFLWTEQALVKLLGFSEWSLRLFPLLCGVGSLFVFRHVASRLLTGVPLVIAVGCLAVSKAAIGLSADAKPYATDLFVAVILLALAVEWLRQPEQTRWLWLLAGTVPVALAFSFPAVFVAGAVSAGLAIPIWGSRNRQTWWGFAACQTALGLAFLLLLWGSNGAQAAAHKEFMVGYWSQFEAFPPADLSKLPAWLASVHLGDKILAVPYGAENGGGLIALACLVCGCTKMFREGQRPLIVIFGSMFVLTFVAAALRQYPYGGHARLTQFLAPALALACGLGAAALLESLLAAQLRRRLTTGLVAGLGLFGLGVGVRAIQHPYHHPYDVRQRDAARNVWGGSDASDSLAICALTDLGEKLWTDGWYPYYRCNQRIYSPRHHAGRPISAADLAALQTPLRLVIYRPPHKALDPQRLADCLTRMAPCAEGFFAVGHEVLNLAAPDLDRETSDAYEIYRLEAVAAPGAVAIVTRQPL